MNMNRRTFRRELISMAPVMTLALIVGIIGSATPAHAHLPSLNPEQPAFELTKAPGVPATQIPLQHNPNAGLPETVIPTDAVSRTEVPSPVSGIKLAHLPGIEIVAEARPLQIHEVPFSEHQVEPPPDFGMPSVLPQSNPDPVVLLQHDLPELLAHCDSLPSLETFHHFEL